ncbi:glycosyl hydrolase family 61-domain-containing protein [Trametes polyzona]|nr:glycosyl hydrolase family 61-domain-containing protein [Trametes polyzona]
MFSSSTAVSLAALALAFVAPTAVNAHGYVQDYNIGGKTYSGWLPFSDPYESPVPNRIERKIPDDGPVLDVTSPDIACNKGGESGVSAYATAAAGSKITFNWGKWPSDHLGPVSTYMASCKGDCTKFDATKAQWFKIDAAGYSNGKWASAQLIDNGFKWTSTIPSQLQSGKYLVRHEIVALHSAGQPQFYPGCAQVEVTGGGNQLPSGSSLVSFPGAYDNAKFPDIWSDNFHSFTIPGPALAFSGSNSGSEEPQAPSSSSTHASSSSAATHTASSTQVHTSAAPSAPASASSAVSRASSVAHTASSAPASKPSSTGTGRCSSKRSRRGMLKRHVSHQAKRHH